MPKKTTTSDEHLIAQPAYNFVPLMVLCSILSACSGDFDVTDSSGKSSAGIPVQTEEVWIEEGVYTKLAKGGACDDSTPFQKIVSLPTGPTYYLKPKPSSFAKTSFSVKLGEDGSLRELTFNAEPSSADTVRATSDLLKAALPALGVAGAASPPPGPTPACDTGEKPKKFTRFSEWITAH